MRGRCVSWCNFKLFGNLYKARSWFIFTFWCFAVFNLTHVLLEQRFISQYRHYPVDVLTCPELTKVQNVHRAIQGAISDAKCHTCHEGHASDVHRCSHWHGADQSRSWPAGGPFVPWSKECRGSSQVAHSLRCLRTRQVIWRGGLACAAKHTKHQQHVVALFRVLLVSSDGAAYTCLELYWVPDGFAQVKMAL